MWFPIPSHDEVHVVLADAFAANLRRIQDQSHHAA